MLSLPEEPVGRQCHRLCTASSSLSTCRDATARPRIEHALHVAAEFVSVSFGRCVQTIDLQAGRALHSDGSFIVIRSEPLSNEGVDRQASLVAACWRSSQGRKYLGEVRKNGPNRLVLLGECLLPPSQPWVHQPIFILFSSYHSPRSDIRSPTQGYAGMD